MNKKKISVVLIVYNEEKNIRNCLESIKDFDDIIIIHDWECKDKTLDIAKEYTDRIFIRPHMWACDQHRIFGFERTKNEWVFIIDADEYITNLLNENIEKLILDESIWIYEFIWPTLYKWKFYNWIYKRALFRKSKIYFIWMLHEYAKPINDNIVIKRTNYILWHNPWYESFSFEKLKTKHLKWAKIHANMLKTPFIDLPKWNCKLTNWEKFNSIRLEYPILLWMFWSSIWYFAIWIKNAIKNKQFFYFVHWFYISVYFWFLYFYYFKWKK